MIRPNMKFLKALKTVWVIICFYGTNTRYHLFVIPVDFRYSCNSLGFSMLFSFSSKNVFILYTLNFNKLYFTFLKHFSSVSSQDILKVFQSLLVAFSFSRTWLSKKLWLLFKLAQFFEKVQIFDKSYYFLWISPIDIFKNFTINENYST